MKLITFLSLCFTVGCVSTSVAGEKLSFEGYQKYYLKTRHDSWVITSPLPMDKSYSELNENQKGIVKKYYSNLGDNDQPPFPVNGTQSLYKAFIKAQYIPIIGKSSARNYNKSNFKRGNVVSVATISETGKAEKVTVLESPSRKLELAITNILFDAKFDSGTCNGKPCQREFLFQIHSGGLTNISQRSEEKYTVYPPENDR